MWSITSLRYSLASWLTNPRLSVAVRSGLADRVGAGEGSILAAAAALASSWDRSDWRRSWRGVRVDLRRMSCDERM